MYPLKNSALACLIIIPTVLMSPIKAKEVEDGLAFINTVQSGQKELQVYFRDWTVACSDSGKGSCYITTYALHKESFDENSQIIVNMDLDNNNHEITYYLHNHPYPISISVDNSLDEYLKPEYLQPFILNEDGHIAHNAYNIKSKYLNNQLLKAFQEGVKTEIYFVGNDHNLHKNRFSLLGVSKAIEYIYQYKTGTN